MSPYVTKHVHQTRLMLDMCLPSEDEALTIYVPAANGKWALLNPSVPVSYTWIETFVSTGNCEKHERQIRVFCNKRSNTANIKRRQKRSWSEQMRLRSSNVEKRSNLGRASRHLKEKASARLEGFTGQPPKPLNRPTKKNGFFIILLIIIATLFKFDI
jgi:hypothetical protein